MKKLLLIIATAALMSCEVEPKGTMEKLHSDDKIELHKFYYDEYGNYVFVAKFKEQPQTASLTWYEFHGSGKSRHRIQRTLIQH